MYYEYTLNEIVIVIVIVCRVPRPLNQNENQDGYYYIMYQYLQASGTTGTYGTVLDLYHSTATRTFQKSGLY